MIRFSLLGSGSSGNALFVATNHTKILVDNGLSFKQLQARCAAIGEPLKSLDGVFVTHEHGDHVNGVGILARKLDVPIYLTPQTYSRLPKGVGRLSNVRHFEAGDEIAVNGLTVSSFSVTHDAVDPVSFVVRNEGVQLGMATDLGKATGLVRQRLAGSHALVLESNYCPQMLRRSPYPPSIRQRIHGSHGHLSNPEMNSLLSSLLHDALKLVVVVHVSQENNREDLARDLARQTMGNHPAQLVVAQQDKPTPLFEVLP